MVFSVYSFPEHGKEWAECKTGDICDCISYEYEKFFNGVGTFTAEFPANTRFRDRITVDSVLVTDSGDYLIAKNIRTTLEKITVSGYDLNGILADRITMTDSEDGYDAQKGSSETIVKHYVNANLVNCKLDIHRNMPRFGIASDRRRGREANNAFPRLQNVAELVTEICGGADLGWRVSIDMGAGGENPVFVFDVAEQVDRSVNQFTIKVSYDILGDFVGFIMSRYMKYSVAIHGIIKKKFCFTMAFRGQQPSRSVSDC